MKKELEEKLYNDFPQLFQDKGKSSQETPMFWGCSIENGWYPWREGEFTPNHIKKLGDSWEFPCILYIWIEKIEDFRGGGANKFFIIERKSLEELGLQLKEIK